MLNLKNKKTTNESDVASGEFLTIGNERFYAIRDVDRMRPFFISVISNSDHWLFVSSTGGLTAGRIAPECALFPYVTVDRVHESWPHTGSKTLLRVSGAGQEQTWEPFNLEHDGRFDVSRNLYKNLLGNKLCFEENNHTLGLSFRYTWVTSDRFGFIRQCELENTATQDLRVEIIDGLQNLLPAGTPRHTQSEASNLVNAYKWNELHRETGLGLFTLYSGISDRAEPVESLRANTVFCLGLSDHNVLLSSIQLDAFRRGEAVLEEPLTRGTRGAYLVNATFDLKAGSKQNWQLVADIEKSQAQVVELCNQLGAPAALSLEIDRSLQQDSDELARIMAAADGFQCAAEENVTTHHYANVMFNVLRGGIFDDQYTVSSHDLIATIRHFNRGVFERHRERLEALPTSLSAGELLKEAQAAGDSQLARLCYEYLPITFGRRHGDPSRPWNHFAIRLKDDEGKRLLFYQGNWRDIFQNWEALALSYPDFIENVIAKFVNASTIDGYNPYRITKEGIDWEIEDPDDPWSYIGYWGDHQIIYLLKLLELSRQFHPDRLARLLREPIFSYANVPYRIKNLDDLLEDPKHTVVYDTELADRIAERVASMGADGKLILDSNGDVYQVNLLDKLLIPLLAKLGNLVVDGGIWLNTQRPEWNDANNALVGQGLSMVTLYYMRRYVSFLRQLLDEESAPVELSIEVTIWLTETATALQKILPLLGEKPIKPDQRYESVRQLGSAAERYRQTVYAQESFSGKAMLPVKNLQTMLGDALTVIDHTIAANRRDDGLYQAYNLMNLEGVGINVDNLYLMLEGQVAVLSSGAIEPNEAIDILESLLESNIYRPDQHSFMLYPDRQLPGFLDKNVIPQPDANDIPLLQKMLDTGDERLVIRDGDSALRFNVEITNSRELEARLDDLVADYGDAIAKANEPLLRLYESVFHHKEFTGRSGTMFGFEGLGSIYWHMVAKLLLAIEENYFAAIDDGADQATCERLGELYYRVREGLGFNKSPAEYGAFPTDPYSHTPGHAGARQPGMTGQVKEEVLCRFAELGVRVFGGILRFEPRLLRTREFSTAPSTFRYLDVAGNWCGLAVPAGALAFTWCQVPILYRLDDSATSSVSITFDDGSVEEQSELQLPAEHSAELFRRSGQIRQVSVTLDPGTLITE
jgi:hypothetical protein